MIRDDRRFKVLLLAICMAFFLFGSARCSNPLFSNNENVSENFSDVNSIEISVQTGSITFESEERNDVLVMAKGIETACISGNLQINGRNGDVKLILPSTMLEKIAIQSATGNISISKTSAKKIRIDTNSGDITISGSRAETIEASSFSGDISLIGNSLSSIIIENTSGRTTIEDGSARDVKIETVSGNIDLSVPQARNISIDSISADAKVKVNQKPYSFSLETASGKAEVFGNHTLASNMDDPELFITFESVSGDLAVSAY